MPCQQPARCISAAVLPACARPSAPTVGVVLTPGPRRVHGHVGRPAGGGACRGARARAHHHGRPRERQDAHHGAHRAHVALQQAQGRHRSPDGWAQVPGRLSAAVPAAPGRAHRAASSSQCAGGSEAGRAAAQGEPHRTCRRPARTRTWSRRRCTACWGTGPAERPCPSPARTPAATSCNVGAPLGSGGARICRHTAAARGRLPGRRTAASMSCALLLRLIASLKHADRGVPRSRLCAQRRQPAGDRRAAGRRGVHAGRVAGPGPAGCTAGRLSPGPCGCGPLRRTGLPA